jgi:ABC-type lipoprotein export system ATPase subunit
MNEEESVVRCEGVSRSYWTETGVVEALDDCTVELFPGRIALISGPSGSGKSTLLKILAGLDQPTSGEVWLAGHRFDALPARRRRRLRARLVSYVFQRPSENFVSFLSVADHLRIAGVRDRAQQSEILEHLDLADRIDELPGTLSGGEQQRAAFAQAMVARRPVVVADEPTAELDHASADRVLEAMEKLAESGACVLVASHDERVMRIADSMVALRDGALEVVKPVGI